MQPQTTAEDLIGRPRNCKTEKQTKGTFQKHERDLWTSLRSDQHRGASTTWEIVDDQIVEASHTLFAVRATRGIYRYASSGTPDVDPHGTTRGDPAGIAATGAMIVEEQEEQCGEHPGGSTREPSGRRHQPIATIHRRRSRREAALRCTTNNARFSGIDSRASPRPR